MEGLCVHLLKAGLSTELRQLVVYCMLSCPPFFVFQEPMVSIEP